MMWEQTLKRITDVTACKAAQQWVDSPEKLTLINNQINCVYRFEHNNQGFYLRLTHEDIRTADDLAGAIDFQHHLWQQKVPVCQPLLSRQNRFIETIWQDNLYFLAHVSQEVPGSIMHFDYADKKPYFIWGQALAKLHSASQTYQNKTHAFKNWQDLWQETQGYLTQEDEDIKALYSSIDNHLQSFTANSANFGLTHADHRPGNVLYDGNHIYIIDFDEPVYHWFITDIAKPFLDLCQTPYSNWQQKFAGFLEGYRTIMPISEEELSHINWFVQMKSLDIYLWCKNNWFEPTAPGGKPRDVWLQELRHMALTPLFP